MTIENAAALHYIMQDDLFLLKSDKGLYNSTGLSPAVIKETQPPAFNYLGDKKKDLLVLVHYTTHEHISETHLTALENILKRKGYELADVAILNIARHEVVDFTELTVYFKPEKILLLGKNSLPQGIEPVKFNELQQLANCTALYSFGFDEMMDNNDNKKAFWEKMKLL